LYVLGVALVVVSLVGARALTNGNGHDKGDAKTVNPAAGGAKVSGPIVLGTVDSDPSPVPYILPPVLQSGTVVKVFVKDGHEVKAGDALYEFDTSLQQRALEKAQAAVGVAKSKVAVAQEKAKEHARKVDLQKQMVLVAKDRETNQKKLYNLVKSNLEQFWKTTGGTKPLTDAEIAKKLEDDDKLFKVYVDYVAAVREVGVREAELAALEASDPQVYVHEADAGVRLAEEEVKTAKTAIDLCTVRAKSAGTVERVTISSGTTLGISTRDPALWLIPAGPRIVRAEIEPDFAHRVGKDIEGKEVTVYDNTDPRLTYKGKVLRVGGTFLPKRSAGDNLLGNDTRVLEATVEVADPAPAGKPPLRVGQRVRVSLGQ
jgi:multidrug resistance efflux pump